MKHGYSVAVVAATLLVAGAVQAGIPIETVTVGNPGNAADTRYATPGYGAVAYEYNIGKFEVTAGQYCAFLNAVAATDTHGLYIAGMSGVIEGSGITRSGSSGTYSYNVAAEFVNRPVNYVSWGDAARFCNWLTNGQRAGAQDLTTTENGSYYINGASDQALLDVTRRTAAQGGRYYIPTEDEWYKAAYYKGSGTNAGYWDYPTRSNDAPGRDVIDVSGDNANHSAVSNGPIDVGKYTTLLGEFGYSASAYGTFDQGGNVWEWNEAVLEGTYRGLRGGSFWEYEDALSAGHRFGNYPGAEYNALGFRVVEVPEPATLSLLILGGLVAMRRRPLRKAAALVLTIGVGVAGTAATRADVFNMESGLTSIETVSVGNPGNAADTRYNGISLGGVAYTYNVGKFEVTAGQYTEFLNAVAKSDPYGLYNASMDAGVYSNGGYYGCNIKRTGSSGSYAYSVAADWANRPANYVSWGDAARFVNWMTNGQPTGTEGLATTEDGSYYLNGATSSTSLLAVTRKAGVGARYVIPTEDEWYKAAYYKGGTTNAGYWDYPTNTSTMPGRDMADASGNNANYNTGTLLIGSPYYRTPVGTFRNSRSAYGTFDQGGNVWEWNQAKIGSSRGVRGGSFSIDITGPQASNRAYGVYPSYEFFDLGFRIAEVPARVVLTDSLKEGVSTQLWDVEDVSSPDAPWSMQSSAASGGLRISKGADNGPQTPLRAGLTSRFWLDGDLTVSVNFDITALPLASNGSWNEVVLALLNANGETPIAVLRFTNNTAQMLEGWSDLPPSALNPTMDSTMHGTLQLERVNSTLSAWIDRGQGPVLVGSLTSSEFMGAMQVEIALAQVQSGQTWMRPHTAMDSTFSDFTATADVITLPEPATLSILALSGVVILRRRK